MKWHKIGKVRKKIQGNIYNLRHPKHSSQIECDSESNLDPSWTERLTASPLLSASVKLNGNQMKYRKLIKTKISKGKISNKDMHG